MPVENGTARLKRYLPRWLQGNVATDVAGAVGAQVDAFDELALGDQIFVASATWGLAFDWAAPDGTVIPSGWERDYQIPAVPADPLEARRARVLARMRRDALRTAADFAAFVQAMTGQGCLPTVFQSYAWWAVFKLCEAGWPSNFIDIEAQLAFHGPAHESLYLAPWDRCLGLPFWELDLMAFIAQDVLEFADMDGGYCVLPTCQPQYLLDYINTQPLDQVNPIQIDWYEYCEQGPPGYRLERFTAVPLRFNPLSLETANSIDLAELVNTDPPPSTDDFLLDVVHTQALNVTNPQPLTRYQEDT